MDPRTAALAEILRLNTKLFRNCLDGLTDAMAGARPSATTNSAAFVEAHHDSYHIGQLALLRKHAGPPAMRYT